MRPLFDSLVDDPRLPPPARALILEAELVHVSSASVWEVAIKTAWGKLSTTIPSTDCWSHKPFQNRFDW